MSIFWSDVKVFFGGIELKGVQSITIPIMKHSKPIKINYTSEFLKVITDKAKSN